MRLTDHTDYSLRVLMYLNQEKRLVTLNELTENLGISKNNLIKASSQLSKLNYIETTRGRSGGLSIRKHAGKITLKEIILKTEESFHFAECFANKESNCTFLPGCLLKHALNDAFHAFLASLSEQTLDDVTHLRNRRK